jgi:type IVB pilus formation R64 PilN family outer membrane protein
MSACRGLCALFLWFLPGCVGQKQLQTVWSQAQATEEKLGAHHHAFAANTATREARLAAQDVARPWLAGKAQPLAREVTLPAALQGNIDTTLLFAGRADLSTLADRIARATSIPVRVRPDALLPQDLFLPRLAVSAAPTVSPPEQLELAAGPQPLPRTLDALAWRLGVYWRYRSGAIEFYRTETRVFDVRALTLSAKVDAKLGRAGTRDAGGFDSTSNTALVSNDLHALDAVRGRIEPFLSRAGTAVGQAGAGSSLVVTDTPDVLTQIAAFIDAENRALTRRIRLVFEEITVTAKDTSESGIDWNAVYMSAGAAATASNLSAAGMGATAFSIAVMQAPFQGSKAIISALNEVGRVVRHSSVPVLTLNRRPVTRAVRTTFSYIDQVQSTSVGATSTYGANSVLPSVSINQKQETVGSFLTLVPDAQQDGQILLSIAYDNTVAQPLKTVTFGQERGQLQVQQITIDGNGTVQQVALRPGQTMIIAGFDRQQDEYDRRRLSDQAPLAAGGLDRVARQRTSTLMLITAQMEEGL